MVVCPRCFANTGEPCETPTGEFAVAAHVSRRRKAESILEDLATLGYLPEIGQETASAVAEAGPPPARVDDQPAQDEDTSPEPAVARGRLQAGQHLQDGVDRREHGPDGVGPAALRPIGEGEHVERAGTEGGGEEDADGGDGDEAADDGHQPYASRGHTLVIPEGGARG